MAQGNSYPAELIQSNGGTVDGVVAIQFTDAAEQPGGTAVPPFHAAATGVTPIVVDSPDGDPLIAIDADAGQIDMDIATVFAGNVTTTGTTSITVGEESGAQLVLEKSALSLNNVDASPVIFAQAGDVAADGQLGFFGVAGITRPTVSNATAPDIIAALAALGLIIDGT